VEWIEPPLDADLEEDVWQDFFDATNPYAAA
jgi:hypothetical protein